MEPTTLIILGIIGVGAFLLFPRSASASSSIPQSTPIGSTGVGSIGVTGQTQGGGIGSGAAIVGTVTAAGAPIAGALLTGGSVAAAVGGTAAAGGGGAAAGTAGAAGGAGISAATAAVTAGIGVAAAIGILLWTKHLQRLKQAKDENHAMNLGVQGFDEGIRLINSQYNSHQIDPQTAIAALKQLMQQYWMEIFPHIQPGRNGCGITAQGTANCPSPIGALPANYCSGNVGAGCCVGCGSLMASLYYDGSTIPAQGAVNAAWYPIPGAIVALQRGGGQSRVFKVYGSKYGGSERADYFLTWNPQ